MSKFTKQISDEVIEILRTVEFRDQGIYLGAPGSMDSKLYKAVCKVLESVGIRWNRKAGFHVPDNGDARQIISDLLGSGEVKDERAEFQFFPTIPEVGERMCEALFRRINPRDTVFDYLLEPSAGTGNLIRAACCYGYGGKVIACEIQDKLCDQLADELIDFWGHEIHRKDFLTLVPEKRYRFILMNPPFSKKRDYAHVGHAIKFLKNHGVLVCLVSQMCKTDWDGVNVEVIEDHVIAGVETSARSKMLRITRQ